MPSPLSRNLGVLALACSALACSEEGFPPGVVELTSGLEPSPWSGVERTRVEQLDADDTRTTYLEVDGSLDEFELPASGAAVYEVKGLDADGATRVTGRSMPLDAAGLTALRVPLLVGHARRFARATELEPSPSPVLTARFGERWILVAPTRPVNGEQQLRSQLFDAGLWAGLALPPSLPCPGASCELSSLAVTADNYALLFGPDGARWYDLEEGSDDELDLPVGVPPEDLAGGQLVQAPDGRGFLVGGTRTGEPTSSVLVIGVDGVLTRAELVGRRSGAAARWIPGRGLLVVGGNDSAAGVELLAEGASSFVALPYPPDPTTGAALVIIDSTRVERVGGSSPDGTDAAWVSIDLGCGGDCSPTPTDGTAPELRHARAWTIAGPSLTHELVSGTNSDGVTAIYEHNPDGLVEHPNQPRRGGSAQLLTTRHLALFGGEDVSGQPLGEVEVLLLD